jgi:two-component system LytT family sensor kinase
MFMNRPLPFRRAQTGYRIGILIAPVFTVPAALSVLRVYVESKVEQHPVTWQSLVYGGSEWLLVGMFTPLIYHLGKLFPFSRAHFKVWLIVHSAGALVLCAGLSSLDFCLGMLLHAFPPQRSLVVAYFTWMLSGLPFVVSIYFALLGCVHAYSYFVEARTREADAARLEAQLSEARLGALRMQLNPHFLFNSLNALSALVREQDTPAASRMLELIGDVLRQVLRPDQPHEIPLSEEMAFLAQYLAIEQVRFSDRLELRWDLQPGALQALVPSFIMQPIVENAIKHGVLNHADAGVIEISAKVLGECVELKVRDNGKGIQPSTGRAGVGLSNVTERLRTLYGNGARLSLDSLSTGGTEATITMPLRVGPE